MSNWGEVSKDDGGMSVSVSWTRDHDAMGLVVAVVVVVVGCGDHGSSGCAGHRWESLLVRVCW